MVRVITQETFDAAVKENREDLGMEPQEAVNEAKQQFEAQVMEQHLNLEGSNFLNDSLKGVDLSNIVLPGSDDGSHAVVMATEALKASLKDASAKDHESAAGHCDVIRGECAKGLPERVLATQNGAYQALVSCLDPEDTSEAASKLKVCAVKALTALMDGNPDPLEQEGFKVIFTLNPCVP